MNLILLAGTSIKNKNWIEEVEKNLKPLFNKTYIHYYQHWLFNSEAIDLENESKILSQKSKSLKEYVVFAKSAGAILALKGIKEGKINPEKCIFTGMAIYFARENNFNIEEWLNNYSVPTLFIQKTNDPAYKFAKLKKLLEDKSVKNFSLLEIPGDNHSYNDMDLIKKEINEFLNRGV